MMRHSFVLAAAATAAFAVPQTAWATNFAVFDFTLTEVGAFSPAPYGSVTVTENAGKLDFSVTLAGTLRFRDQGNGDNQHTPFTFSLVNDPTVQVTALSSVKFEAVALASGDSVNATPFGSYYTGIDCPGCTKGYTVTNPNTLSFTVGAKNAQQQDIFLTLASLATNNYKGSTVYFGADVVSATGKTGSIGAVKVRTGNNDFPPLPEPATWAMMIVGFGFVGASMRRRARKGQRQLRLPRFAATVAPPGLPSHRSPQG
jgi:hypothetical protein